MTPDMGRTTTVVQNEESALMQKRRAEAVAEGTLCGLNVYVQLLLIMCFGLFEALGTAAWQSVLFALPLGLLPVLLSRLSYQKTAPKWTLLLLLPALAFDMLLALMGVCELSAVFVVPGTNRFLIALLTCATVYLSLLSSGAPAYARLGRLALPFLFFSLLWCVLTSVRNMKLSNLTPVLGLGLKPTLLMALLPLGCMWQGPLFLLMDRHKGEKAPRAYRYILLSVGLAVATALLTALLWPMEGFLAPMSPPKRMMILNQSSSSTATWSLLVFSWLFALFICLGSCARGAQRVAARFFPSRKLSWLLMLMPFLLVIWPASLGLDELAGLAIRWSPLRYVLALLCALMTLIFGKGERACEKSA